ncbi:MAG: hypothetical protein FWC27_04045 [Firmicutes bacterium]|nr:hypothetical protein [Bacillota bacterium]
MTETQKLLKRFALASLLLLCVTAMLCGAALVDTNTRYLSLGDPGRQVGIALDRETTTIRWDARTAAVPSFGAVIRWARLAPVPAGCVIAIGEAIWRAAE